MATVVLLRHGRTTANAGGVLAGRTPGVELDEVGRDQVRRARERLAGVALAEIVSSPLERCRQTAEAVASGRSVTVDDAITECDYGQWQGRPLAELAREDLWSVVQAQPSAARFPDGESLVEMQARSVGAIRDRDAAVESSHGPSAVWIAVSHGDIIKSVLADALGMHLDQFQRLDVHPASMSIVRYSTARPQVLAVNSTAGDLAWLAAQASPTVGGGTPTHS